MGGGGQRIKEGDSHFIKGGQGSLTKESTFDQMKLRASLADRHLRAELSRQRK